MNSGLMKQKAYHYCLNDFDVDFDLFLVLPVWFFRFSILAFGCIAEGCGAVQE